MVIKRNQGGSKLSRTEILQARINSRQRLALDIMARKERRTTSSFIEGLIEKAAKEMEIDMIPLTEAHTDIFPMRDQPEYQRVTVEKAVRQIWSPGEPERFIAFAMTFPELLNAEEMQLWEIISATPYFWAHYRIEVKDENTGKSLERWWPIQEYRGLILEHLLEAWEPLNDLLEKHIPVDPELIQKMNLVGKKVETPPAYLKDISILLGTSYGH
jgi:hypothetical protein